MKLLIAGLALSAFGHAPWWAVTAEEAPPGSDDCERGIKSLVPSGPEAGERFDDPARGAKGFGFIRSALAVELNDLYVEFHEGFLRGPRCFRKSFVRAYVHEVLHFWQTLSQGFITNLALQEWMDVQEFKQTGGIQNLKGLISRFADRPKGAPFSAWELSESLCRFWDIHIMGPVLLLQERGEALDSAVGDARPYQAAEFDRLMTIEDAYAAPYRWALDQWGSNASVLLFPLAGHFAMQTQRPVSVFLKAGESLRTQLQQMQGSIHKNWPAVFPQVRQVCEEANFNLTKGMLTPGWDVIHRSELRKVPIWSHYLELLRESSKRLSGMRELDYCFSLPGDPSSRGILTSVFLPALTLFQNGRWFGQSSFLKSTQEAHGREAPMDTTSGGLSSPRDLADLSESVVRDYRAMRKWITLRRYGL